MALRGFRETCHRFCSEKEAQDNSDIVTIQMNGIESYFLEVLFCYIVEEAVQTFESVNK